MAKKKEQIADQAAPEQPIEPQAEQASEQAIEPAPALDLEAIKKQAKDEAFDEMARALGQDPAKLRAAAASKSVHEGEAFEVDLGTIEVHVNGQPYIGVVRGTYEFVQQLASMAGAKRNRILNEKIGNQGIVDMLNSGIRTRIVGKMEE